LITIKHRNDRFLQEKLKMQPEGFSVSKDVEFVTWPAYAAMVEFMDKHIVTQDFRSLNELKKALSNWPAFYSSKIDGMTFAKIDKRFQAIVPIADQGLLVIPNGLQDAPLIIGTFFAHDTQLEFAY
jgi:hypothetical protein